MGNVPVNNDCSNSNEPIPYTQNHNVPDLHILIFYQIGKCASTTVGHYLSQKYFTLNIHSLFQRFDVALCSDLLDEIERPICILGHDCNDIHLDVKLFRPYYYITFLREPFSRFISAFNYYNNTHVESMNVQEYFNSYNHNLFTKCFGNGDLEKAKDIIGSQFFLFGVVEYFESSIELLNRYFHFASPISKRLNVSPKNVVPYDNLFYEKFYYHNKLDVSLYDWALNKFKSRLESLNISYKSESFKMVSEKPAIESTKILPKEIIIQIAESQPSDMSPFRSVPGWCQNVDSLRYIANYFSSREHWDSAEVIYRYLALTYPNYLNDLLKFYKSKGIASTPKRTITLLSDLLELCPNLLNGNKGLFKNEMIQFRKAIFGRFSDSTFQETTPLSKPLLRWISLSNFASHLAKEQKTEALITLLDRAYQFKELYDCIELFANVLNMLDSCDPIYKKIRNQLDLSSLDASNNFLIQSIARLFIKEEKVKQAVELLKRGWSEALSDLPSLAIDLFIALGQLNNTIDLIDFINLIDIESDSYLSNYPDKLSIQKALKYPKRLLIFHSAPISLLIYHLYLLREHNESTIDIISPSRHHGMIRTIKPINKLWTLPKGIFLYPESLSELEEDFLSQTYDVIIILMNQFNMDLYRDIFHFAKTMDSQKIFFYTIEQCLDSNLRHNYLIP